MTREINIECLSDGWVVHVKKGLDRCKRLFTNYDMACVFVKKMMDTNNPIFPEK